MMLPLSRRDFLKVSSTGLPGVFLADLRLPKLFDAQIPKQGRSTISGVELLSDPSYRAKKIRTFGRDETMDIIGAVQGDYGYGNPLNSTWYQISGGGYVYSGTVQPVETMHNKPVFDISEPGVLGEVTVPFSDTRRSTAV